MKDIDKNNKSFEDIKIIWAVKNLQLIYFVLHRLNQD